MCHLIRSQIASGINIIIQLGRLRDKSRRVLEIAELDGIVDGEIVLNTLYQFEEISEKDGRVIGELVQKGKLKSRTKLEAAGMRDIDGL